MVEKILNNTTPYGKIRASHEGSLHSSTLKDCTRKVQTKRRKIGQVKVCRSAGVLQVLEVCESIRNSPLVIKSYFLVSKLLKMLEFPFIGKSYNLTKSSFEQFDHVC